MMEHCMKTKTHRDRKYLDWLREQPCVVSGSWPPSDPCHTFKSTGGGGIGLKSSDKTALPLSHAEHQKQSLMSELGYWREILGRRPGLRTKMIRAYNLMFPDFTLSVSDDRIWAEFIENDDILIKQMVQAFAETEYYNQFLKGPMP